MVRYRPRRTDDDQLRAQSTALALARPRFGFAPADGAAAPRRRDGQSQTGRARLSRRRPRAAATPTPRPRGHASGRQPGPAATESLLVDGLHAGTLADGRAVRVFTLVDAFTREALAIEVDHSLPGPRVVRTLETVAARRPVPSTIVIDNGTEFTGRVLDAWAYHRRVALHFIAPGKPVQNPYIEGSMSGSATNA